MSKVLKNIEVTALVEPKAYIMYIIDCDGTNTEIEADSLEEFKELFLKDYEDADNLEDFYKVLDKLKVGQSLHFTEEDTFMMQVVHKKHTSKFNYFINRYK